MQTPSLTMQETILRLQAYWSSVGCMIMQPINTEVGAGTANPATALRVLGPEPWRAAYVEPSVRPDDSRYGLNPNRLQTHTQFQVILKPEPGNAQELYLESLEAIGVDIRAHDVRFVEDNWASPALGAWGLGWEVWLDGMEISQFTYFQQLGGLNLSPVPVEITYGLERIIMALQGVTHFKDIRLADSVSYGEVFGQPEYEMSRYYLDDADIDATRAFYEQYAAEARRLLDLGLSVPAYNFALKCSHSFNVLDARGAVSTTERAKAFATMRGLVRECAKLWVASRAELGHPLGDATTTPSSRSARHTPEAVADRSNALLEIGLEELPASEVKSVRQRVAERLQLFLDGTELRYASTSVDATPRRIVIRVDAVEPTEVDVTKSVRGPRWTSAFDSAGNATPALHGFLRKHRVAESTVVKRQVEGNDYAVIDLVAAGRPAAEVLVEIFESIVATLKSESSIRWADPVLSYARPIRWLLALFGATTLDVRVSELRSGHSTRLLRTSLPPTQVVESPEAYDRALATERITLARSTRRQKIIEVARALAASAGSALDEHHDAELIDEVADLVEAPFVLLGRFDSEYLELPAAVLTTVMKKHQRYLPLWKDNQLFNAFIIVANGTPTEEVVRSGNEAVLRARFEDARFFWRHDLQVRPADLRDSLSKLLVEERLGSYLDKSRRIEQLARDIAARLRISTADAATLVEAGAVAKFDFATQLVAEFPSLAGTMARHYALHAGFTAEAALALEEMELPRASGTAVPTSSPGAILALADRIDSLVGLIAVGTESTSSADPFGIRRLASGVVAILRAFPTIDLSFAAIADMAAARIAADGIVVSERVALDVIDLLTRRFEQQLLAEGADATAVRAVLARSDRPAEVDKTLAALSNWTETATRQSTLETLNRIVRVVPSDAPIEDPPLRDELLPVERELKVATEELVRKIGSDADLERYLREFELVAPIADRFLNTVRVMDDDPGARVWRIALLRSISEYPAAIVDLTAL